MLVSSYFSSSLMRRVLFGCTLLLTLYWFVQQTFAPITPPHSALAPSQALPDYVVKGLTARRFDEAGNLIEQLYSPKMIHFAKDNSSRFEKPEVRFFDDSQQSWQINANEGEAFSGHEKVILNQRVVIQQNADYSNTPITILTSQLIVHPDKNQAETEAPITLKQPGMEVHSVGMQADFTKKNVVLKSRARGVYERPQA